jgi:DNA ligase 1
MVHRFAHLCEALVQSAPSPPSADAPEAATAQQAALLRYFEAAQPPEAAWAAYLLGGGRLRPTLAPARLQALAPQLIGLPPWLFETSLQAAGDWAECVALLLPPPARQSQHGLAYWMEERLQPLLDKAAEPNAGALPTAWCQELAQACNELEVLGRELILKLLTGTWKRPVSALVVQHALAQRAGISTHTVAQRLPAYGAQLLAGTGASRSALHQTPMLARYQALLAPPDAGTWRGEPVPMAPEPKPLGARSAQSLGDIESFWVSWWTEGLTAQVVKRGGACFIWSAQGELWTPRLPELQRAVAHWPDGTVLCGELLAWPTGASEPLPPARLQQRLQRKTLTPQLLQERPVVFVAHDVLEWQGADLRALPLRKRLAHLQRVFETLNAPTAPTAPTALTAPNAPHAPHAPCAPHATLTAIAPAAPAALTAPIAPIASTALRLAPRLEPADWAAAAALRQAARSQGALGLLLRSLDTVAAVDLPSPSQPPGAAGALWSWPAEPLTLTTVLLYAHAGYGGSGNAFSDFSFGVWNRPPRDAAEVQAVQDAIAAKKPPPTDPQALRWVPVAKARSGLNDPDMHTLLDAVRSQALEKFGPVRSLQPSLVVQLAFDRITPSSRHKSGWVLGGARMLRLQTELPLQQVDSLVRLRALLFDAGPSPQP